MRMRMMRGLGDEVLLERSLELGSTSLVKSEGLRKMK